MRSRLLLCADLTRCVSVPLQLTGELELDVLWLKSADPGRPLNAGSEALWRESSSSNGPVNVTAASHVQCFRLLQLL